MWFVNVFLTKYKGPTETKGVSNIFNVKHYKMLLSGCQSLSSGLQLKKD